MKTVFDVAEPIRTAAEIALADDPFLPARDKVMALGMPFTDAMTRTETQLWYALDCRSVYTRRMFDLFEDQCDPDARDLCTCGFEDYRYARGDLADVQGWSLTYQELCAADDASAA